MLELSFTISAVFFVLTAIFYSFKHIILLPNQEKQIKECIHEQRFDEAEFLIREFLKNDMRNIKLHYFLADTYWLSSREVEALPIFEKFYNTNFSGLELSQKKNTLYRLAQWNKKNQVLTDAFAFAEELIELDSETPKFLLLMAEVLIDQKNFSQALPYLESILGEDPSHKPAMILYADLLFILKQNKDAFKVYTQLSELQPHDTKTWFRLGELSERLKDKEKALKFYQKAEGHNYCKLSIQALYRMGMIYKSLNKNKDSVLALEKARTKINNHNIPTDSIGEEFLLNLYYELGEQYLADKQIGPAISIWEEIKIIDSNYKDVPQKLQEHNASQMNDFFKDLLTNRGDKLISIICDFVKSLGFAVESYSAITPEFIEITVSEIFAKWRDIRRRKLLFAFWCSDLVMPEDIPTIAYQKMQNVGASKIHLVSAGPILSDTRAFIEKKVIDLYDITNIERLINENKKNKVSEL